MSKTGPNFDKPRTKAQPDFDDRQKTTHRARRHENRIAQRSGDSRVSGSGNKPGRPGDIKGKTFLREAKTTRGAGRQISGEELRKITAEALSQNRIPMMEICFEGQSPPTPQDWVLIPAQDFERLMRGEAALNEF